VLDPAVATVQSPSMDAPAQYLQLGVIVISYPNLIVIALMVVLFAIALLAPFGHDDGEGRR
jgi:hypothetical protein